MNIDILLTNIMVLFNDILELVIDVKPNKSIAACCSFTI